MKPAVLPTIDNSTGEFLQSVLADFYDDAKFAVESLSIEDMQGKIVPLEMNPGQLRLLEVIRKIQERRRPVRVVVLKSRRCGFTTGIAAKIFRETVFTPGQHALVVAHDLKALRNVIYPMYQRYQQLYKPFRNLIALPELVTDTQQMMAWSNGSSIEIRSASNTEGVRSANLRRCHLSEYSVYRDAATLMTALTSTVPRDPDTMMIAEFTAQGVGGPAWELWKQASDPTSGSEWVPLFFGCWDDPNCRMDLTIDAEKFEKSLTDEECELRQRFRLSLEQLNWRRWSITNNFHGNTDLHTQEFPGTAEEAFLAKGSPVFDRRAVARFTAVAGTTGDLTLERIGIEKRVVFSEKSHQPLEVWERPQRGHQYVIGVDTASGLNRSGDDVQPDRDYSVAQVRDRQTGKQVARFRSRDFAERYFGEQVYVLAVWYNNAYIVPEVAGGYGRAMLDAVLERGYPMHLIYRTAKQGPVRYDDLGWNTNVGNRSRLIGGLDRAITEHGIETLDAITIQEYLTFVKDNQGKPTAAQGSHDDCVIADALAVVGLEASPISLVSDHQPGKPGATGPMRYGGTPAGYSGYMYERGNITMRRRDGRS